MCAFEGAWPWVHHQLVLSEDMGAIATSFGMSRCVCREIRSPESPIERWHTSRRSLCQRCLAAPSSFQQSTIYCPNWSPWDPWAVRIHWTQKVWFCIVLHTPQQLTTSNGRSAWWWCYIVQGPEGLHSGTCSAPCAAHPRRGRISRRCCLPLYSKQGK